MLNDLAAHEDAAEESTGDDVVDIDDAAGVLAEASNKRMTPGTVEAIMDRLEDTYGDDYSNLTEPDDAGEDSSGEEPSGEDSFAKALSDRVNEINGYAPEDDEAEL